MDIDREHLRIADLSAKLNHIRWGQGILLMEKWFAIIIVCTLILTEFSLAATAVFAVALFLVFVYASTRQAALEDSVGLPGQRVTIKI